MADAEQFDGLLKPDALRRGAAFEAEIQVAEDIEMGEQAGFLKDVADGPLVRRQPGFFVLPDFALEFESTVGRFFQPGQAAQQGGFSRAGMAEQRRDTAAGQGEVDIQREAGPVEFETGIDAVHFSLPSPAWGGGRTWRAAP